MVANSVTVAATRATDETLDNSTGRAMAGTRGVGRGNVRFGFGRPEPVRNVCMMSPAHEAVTQPQTIKCPGKSARRDPPQD